MKTRESTWLVWASAQCALVLMEFTGHWVEESPATSTLQIEVRDQSLSTTPALTWWPWPSYSTSLSLSLLACKMGLMVTAVLLSTFLFSIILVTSSQPRSENISWKIPEIKYLKALNCAPFWVAWWNLTLSCSVPWDVNRPFVQRPHALAATRPLVS